MVPDVIFVPHTAAAPGDVFFGREWRMAVGVPILLGGLLLSLPNLALVDDRVVLIGHAVDLDGAEGETLESAPIPPCLRTPDTRETCPTAGSLDPFERDEATRGPMAEQDGRCRLLPSHRCSADLHYIYERA